MNTLRITRPQVGTRLKLRGNGDRDYQNKTGSEVIALVLTIVLPLQ